ncbi:SDR family oxidoreductase [Mycobacterium sp. CBMA293]|uniref:3-oxoacyl-[acyl-carrier-protein] reductase MabA n=2 Tax=unclassified Mycolicibacterium TaxID=2636767 RepID=A0A1S6GKP1_9MYCO|nr:MULTISPECIES: SDR family oxidoreductase [unclassified Mycolicibacterium]AQS22428.1 3-oxoacyl-[acyl-carrier-protein] reductase FabG [Mycolicibacterium sp. CBMA 213]MUL50141.1 SDR family oxidoreductase [Mycolicibacterium sp. CBMA 360]MUL62342.1 SDR family oxidoreductase [Mycolicibacterium sp. CBMA 335]MUM04479.1 hypothetical protein [Mycolicibacterium sp. CBMA 213]MUM14742.1 SDR family oxidoreductase [Mycolicibacterium sp. CBMA 293]
MTADTSGAAVVTGGTQGIGLAIARELVAAGRRVAIFGVSDDDRGRAAAADLGGGTQYLRCDVAVEAEVQRAMNEVADLLGPVEVLVNNAGVGAGADPAELTEDRWDAFFSIDLKGVWLCSKYAIPQMRQRGGGAIVNISSIHAHMTRSGMFPYAAAKAGVLGLTRSLALDVASQNIRVNAVCPGYVRTAPMVKLLDSQPDPDAAWDRLSSVHPIGRIGTPDEIAYVVGFLASDRAAFVTGATWNVDGGLSARFAT